MQDPDEPACLRSDHNYPSLVADKLGRADLVDVTCGGASTDMVRKGRTTPQGAKIGPQLAAVGAGTTLVTINIGGADQNTVGGMFTYCLIPATATESGCRKLVSSYLPKVYPATTERVSSILEQIRKRAPKARVVLVGYLRIVPEQGQCAVLPVPEANRAGAMQVETTLNSALRDAAAKADVPFVDVRSVSRGHDVCAGPAAWVNGIVGKPGDGTFLHPNAAGMAAVAGEVLKAVDKS